MTEQPSPLYPPTTPLTEEEVRAAVLTIQADPLNYYGRNPPQDRFFSAISNVPEDRLTVIPFLKGNGVGGTWGLVSAWSAIMWQSQNERFVGQPWGARWPFLKSARIVSTIKALEDKGPIQTAMRKLFPSPGRWTQNRGAGKPYFSEGSTDSGWDFDFLTYDTAALQSAGANKGLVIFSEPPPYDVFTETCTRLRGRGLVLIDMTQLDMAAYIEDIVAQKGLFLNGKKVGEVRVVRGTVDENCVECYPPDSQDPSKPHGMRSHASIDADVALWPPEEREARRTGRPLSLSGRIYPKFDDPHELEALPEYHQDCWNAKKVIVSSVIDPHDRKPWAMAWFATFPNSDVIGFAEWPPFDFHEAKSSPVSDIEDYRQIILETEREIGMEVLSDNRLMDPNFGAAPKAGSGKSVKALLAEPCRACKAKYPSAEDREALYTNCTHRLQYLGAPNDIPTGHTLVRAKIGDPLANPPVRPKFYVLKAACPNLSRSMRKYAYLENKSLTARGLSEVPQYVEKDFADLPRYLMNAMRDMWPALRPDPDSSPPPVPSVAAIVRAGMRRP